MSNEHPNLALLKRLDFRNLEGAADLFADDFVHFFNHRWPEMEGDHVGLSGLRSFFEKLGAATKSSFQVEPVWATAVGDELVVMHNRTRLTFEGVPVETDVVVVRRSREAAFRRFGTSRRSMLSTFNR